MEDELQKVRKLVLDGLCDVYILMTNAGVSGKLDARLRSRLIGAGVNHALLLGSTWIESQIRENTRLRMLVPRLYGLGDLSQILDARAYAQARAVLESLREDLAKVVITDSYRRAIHALDEYGFVLLIGEPAAGKTTIASMLAMAAADKWKSSVLKIDDPAKAIAHWNVEEASQFFWIDDAFGVTQYESPLVHGWNHSLGQVRTMLRLGAKIVMTSRDYIYNRARRDLKESAFPLLKESQVVIDVHELTESEKQQILYNHLKLGRQPGVFRSKIKPHLEYLAGHPRFIPEIARRVSDPYFTQSLQLNRYHLDQFIEKREQLLQEVIQGLDAHSKAALGLVYMRKDNLESPVTLRGSEPQALERLGSTLGQCILALEALDGSLVIRSQLGDASVWRFKHPTIGDAYAGTLAFSAELLEIFLIGSSTENLLSQVTCGHVGIEKAVVIPGSLFPTMVSRLREFSAGESYKVSWMSSWAAQSAVYGFLARRCSKDFLSLYLQQEPAILEHVSEPGLRLDAVREVDLAVRLHQVGLLSEDKRAKFVQTVSSYAIEGEDLYALADDDIRSVFSEDELGRLIGRVRDELVPKLDKVRWSVQCSHVSFDSPEEHMRDLLDSLEILENVYAGDVAALSIIKRETRLAKDWIAETETPEEPKVEPRTLGDIDPSERNYSTRSIFDDIDEG